MACFSLNLKTAVDFNAEARCARNEVVGLCLSEANPKGCKGPRDAKNARSAKVGSSTNSHKSPQIGFVQMCVDLWTHPSLCVLCDLYG